MKSKDSVIEIILSDSSWDRWVEYYNLKYFINQTDMKGYISEEERTPPSEGDKPLTEYTEFQAMLSRCNESNDYTEILDLFETRVQDHSSNAEESYDTIVYEVYENKSYLIDRIKIIGEGS